MNTKIEKENKSNNKYFLPWLGKSLWNGAIRLFPSLLRLMNGCKTLGDKRTGDECHRRPADEHEIEIVLQLIEDARREHASEEQI